jgi:hypothetical protein
MRLAQIARPDFRSGLVLGDYTFSADVNNWMRAEAIHEQADKGLFGEDALSQ